MHWYRKSAEQGDASGQYHLATMYEAGEGVEQSDLEFYKWCSLAFTRKEPKLFWMTKLISWPVKTIVGFQLDSAQKKEADEWVKNWKPTPSPNQWTSWMFSDEFQKTYNKNQNNYFPSAIEGRYSKKGYEYRAIYEPFPRDQINWYYYYGLSMNAYDEKIKDLKSKNYVLLSHQTFSDSQNQEFYQAVWVTGKNKVVKCVKQGKKWFKSTCE